MLASTGCSRARQGRRDSAGDREHDILVVTETGALNITTFPFGPEHNIIRN